MLTFTAAKIPTRLVNKLETVWSKHGDLPAIAFDTEEVETMFRAVEHKKSTHPANKHSTKLELVTLLDPKRENNCGIALAHLKLPHAQIVMALLALDPTMLSHDPDEAADLIELLQVCSATPEESACLAHYDEGHPAGSKDHLSPVDKFFLELINGVGDDVPERLKCVHDRKPPVGSSNGSSISDIQLLPLFPCMLFFCYLRLMMLRLTFHERLVSAQMHLVEKQNACKAVMDSLQPEGNGINPPRHPPFVVQAICTPGLLGGVSHTDCLSLHGIAGVLYYMLATIVSMTNFVNYGTSD